MAKPRRPERKRQKAKPIPKTASKPVSKPVVLKPVQPPLPGMPPPETPGTIRVFPMQVGDKFSDESSEWEVIAHPYATVGGKSTHVRVQRVDKPGVTEARTWGSYEKVTVMRRAAASSEGKR